MKRLFDEDEIGNELCGKFKSFFENEIWPQINKYISDRDLSYLDCEGVIRTSVAFKSVCEVIKKKRIKDENQESTKA